MVGLSCQISRGLFKTALTLTASCGARVKVLAVRALLPDDGTSLYACEDVPARRKKPKPAGEGDGAPGTPYDTMDGTVPKSPEKLLSTA